MPPFQTELLGVGTAMWLCAGQGRQCQCATSAPPAPMWGCCLPLHLLPKHVPLLHPLCVGWVQHVTVLGVCARCGQGRAAEVIPVRGDQVMLALIRATIGHSWAPQPGRWCLWGNIVKKEQGEKERETIEGTPRLGQRGRRKDLHGYGVFLLSNHYMCLVHLS